jgi:hypothetical protein
MQKFRFEYYAIRTILLASVSISAEPVGKKKHSKAGLEAADRLLKAVKQKLVGENGEIDYSELRRKGYSEAMLHRLKEI